MIVVADTSPLNYLIQIDCDHLLPRLFGRILVPNGVMDELAHTAAPPKVKAWLIQPPAWIDVNVVQLVPDPRLAILGRGEREAIQLAETQNAHLLLIDERKGRQEAMRRGLKTTGTLGVLISAGELGLIKPASAYRRLLDETTFRATPALESRFLEQVRTSGERP
ncbi:MAG TPA: hypothetical protein VG267_09570 [Terracidiphilus sp.]|jgi:predicted nucleic acid-binding protein|nr:hypothetical protein [Terracidiphilus sp.]